MANGGLLHTPEWGVDGNAPVGQQIDVVKHPYVKSMDTYDVVTEDNIKYYHSNEVIQEYELNNGVFDWGNIQQFTWHIKVEANNSNKVLEVTEVDETLGAVEVGRIVDQVSGAARGEVAKVVRNNANVVTRIYLRNVSTGASFADQDVCLGSNGFQFRINADPISIKPYYIDFGTHAERFGPFVSGQYYFAPENIKVRPNDLIIFDQTDASNYEGSLGHPIRFSTTPNGPLNESPGTLYYQSTGVSDAPAADYETNFKALFIMNADETEKIYYHCAYHLNMGGYDGDEGYMILDTASEQTTYTVSVAAKSTGHPFYGQGSGKGYYISGGIYNNVTEAPALTFVRGYTYIFNQNDSSNTTHAIYFSELSSAYGGTNRYEVGVTYKINGSSVDYATYAAGHAAATSRSVSITVSNSAPNTLYYACQAHGYMGASINIINDTAGVISDPYYSQNFYQSDLNDPNTIDRSRHVNGHSKILGMSYDGYPIYGPYGYNSSGAVAREVSSYRLRTTSELAGNRPVVNTVSTVTYAVTISNGQFMFDGSRPSFLELDRGTTYIFNQNDSSNTSQHLLISTTNDGWHGQNPVVIGNTANLYSGNGIKYYIDGSEVSYLSYLSGFNLASTRELRFTVPVDSPAQLFLFAYTTAGHGIRTVQEGYVLGDLVGDYIYDSSVGSLDEFNGKFDSTPEYPNGTYAYFMTEDSNADPTYPYAIGPKMYGVPLAEGDTVPDAPTIFPTLAEGEVILNDDGTVSYVRMTKKGDNFFGTARAEILGGQGSGAIGSPIVQTVTGLSLLTAGRSYATPPTLIFEGGGGQGAQGAAEIDTLGKVTSINVVDDGEFYQEPPFVLVTGGGGIGAKAVATIDQGKIIDVTVTEPGSGYTSPPNVVFTKLVNLKRKSRARQSNNSGTIFLTGLAKNVSPSDSTIFVDSTDAYPGSGQIILNKETITYTSKASGKFSGLTRGVNFNYDQRVILDAGQNDSNGNSTYQFSVGDRVIRKIENANNKVAKVYDWNPATRELLVTFEVDELAFIDGGRPSTEDAIVQFDAGVAASSGTGVLPHTTEASVGNSITTLTVPIGTIADTDFVDIAENAGAGDGIPDLDNTNTDFLNQISLDGGIFSSLYGIEETVGGQNTTLFQVGDNIKDGSIPFKFASVDTAGALSDGVEHNAQLKIFLDATNANGANYSVNEIVTGSVSNVQATVVSWDPSEVSLIVQNVVPYNTGNIAIGIAGYLYEFSQDGTIVDFNVQNPGTNYSAPPTVAIENTGDIQATATAVLTAAGDQVASLTITNGGYGIPQTVDGTFNLHPTVTFTNASGDTTGAGAVAQAILGGENLVGNAGATYRIKRIEYLTTVRSK